MATGAGFGFDATKVDRKLASLMVTAGLHVMPIGLRRELKTGDKVGVPLRFEKVRDGVVEATVWEMK